MYFREIEEKVALELSRVSKRVEDYKNAVNERNKLLETKSVYEIFDSKNQEELGDSQSF